MCLFEIKWLWDQEGQKFPSTHGAQHEAQTHDPKIESYALLTELEWQKLLSTGSPVEFCLNYIEGLAWIVSGSNEDYWCANEWMDGRRNEQHTSNSNGAYIL